MCGKPEAGPGSQSAGAPGSMVGLRSTPGEWVSVGADEVFGFVCFGPAGL